MNIGGKIRISVHLKLNFQVRIIRNVLISLQLCFLIRKIFAFFSLYLPIWTKLCEMFTSAEVAEKEEIQKEKWPLILRPETPTFQLSLQSLKVVCFVDCFHLGLGGFCLYLAFKSFAFNSWNSIRYKHFFLAPTSLLAF